MQNPTTYPALLPEVLAATVLSAFDDGGDACVLEGAQQPERLLRLRADLERVQAQGEAIPSAPELSVDQLGALAYARATAGLSVDLVALVRQHEHEPALYAKARDVHRAAVTRAASAITAWVMSNTEAIVRDHVAAAYRMLLTEVRDRLAPDCPTRPQEAVHGDEQQIRMFRTLEQLAARYEALRRFHGLLVAPKVNTQMAALVLFGDCKRAPAWDLARTTLPSRPEGPVDAGPRLLWLAFEDCEPWMPPARELVAHYEAWLEACHKRPAPPARPLSVVTRVSSYPAQQAPRPTAGT